jgi:hypothetical protein
MESHIVEELILMFKSLIPIAAIHGEIDFAATVMRARPLAYGNYSGEVLRSMVITSPHSM